MFFTVHPTYKMYPTFWQMWRSLWAPISASEKVCSYIPCPQFTLHSFISHDSLSKALLLSDSEVLPTLGHLKLQNTFYMGELCYEDVYCKVWSPPQTQPNGNWIIYLWNWSWAPHPTTLRAQGSKGHFTRTSRQLRLKFCLMKSISGRSFSLPGFCSLYKWPAATFVMGRPEPTWHSGSGTLLSSWKSKLGKRLSTVWRCVAHYTPPSFS